jgi:tetratricopeptide (TPR) repeat protein
LNQTDYYAVLEVSEQATEEEIKRAYFRKVRDHSPEQDPKGFQLVRTAYETLSDARKRADYDATRAFGGKISKWMDEAVQAMEEEEHETAIDLLKKVVALNPHAYAAWDMLGAAYYAEEEYGDAARVFRRLATEQPEVVSHHLHLGMCLAAVDQVDEARRAFLRAHELQPYNAQPCLHLARTYQKEEQWSQAIVWLERAIGADGKEDVFDFDALVELAMTYVLMGEAKRVREVGRRAERILPTDSEARSYGALRFAAVGASLHQLKAFEEAAIFFAVASRLAPHDAELKEFARVSNLCGRCMRELRQLIEDQRILEPVKQICVYVVHARLGIEGADDFKHVAQFAALTLRAYDRNRVEESVSVLKSDYPAVYEVVADCFKEFSRTTQPPPQYRTAPTTPHGTSGSPSYGSSGSGCVLVVFALLSLIHWLTR